MPKIERPNANVRPFAEGATGLNRTVFGRTTQSDDLTDNLTPEFLKGWEITASNDSPTKQDFNGMGYTLSGLLSYLYQMGVPEWNEEQEYFINSFAQHGGKLYISTVGTADTPNIRNAPDTSSAQWKLFDELVLAESILDTRENAVPNAKTVYAAINNAAGANSIPTYYPGSLKISLKRRLQRAGR